MKNNQHYIIELELQTCGVEKTTTKIVTAADETEAIQSALLSELHNELGNGAEWDLDNEESGRIWDFDLQWVYTANKVTAIESEEEYAILKKYL